MESKISKRLDDIDFFINYVKDNRTKAENAKSTVDEIVFKALRTMDQLQLYKDNYEQNKERLASVNLFPSASNESDCKKADGFGKVLEDFIYRIYPLTEELRELIKQLNLNITGLEVMRRKTENAKTSEELENVSLGTQHSVNLNLMLEADDMKSEWVKMDLKREVDKLLDALRGQVDKETEGLTKP